MRFAADLHVHSRYSRATSRDADLAGYYRWARLKGIHLIGTGDFTHPRWMEELSSRLVEKHGLYVLADPPQEPALPGAAPADIPVHFVPTVEISSIYKKRGSTRKVHSLIIVRTLEQARRLAARLAAIGNVASDGRPILGLDPKDLLAILLETAPDGIFIPAHIWTPWFSLFGSKSGFDAIEECFEDLSDRISALETGLSSDPPMNWRWSALDRYRLVSNSDAHSPPNLGREATLLDTDLSWDGVAQALTAGRGFLGTVEFYPEEGKYHFDGHRDCGVCLDPDQTRQRGGLCPACGKPLTVGVLHRVLALADRPHPERPTGSQGFRSVIPLPEILAELSGQGAGSQAVGSAYARVVSAFGSEYGALLDAPVGDLERSQGPLLAEAVRRMREGRVEARPGYDGEFGVIRVFDDSELARLRGQDELFPASARRGRRTNRGRLEPTPVGATIEPVPASPTPLDLDEEQRAVIESSADHILVSAGPGSGKTRLLTSWIASSIRAGTVAPAHTLALTFTNRAADELAHRLSAALGRLSAPITASTFHSFCWSILRNRPPAPVTVYGRAQRAEMLEILFPDHLRAWHPLGETIEHVYEGMALPDEELAAMMARYEEELARFQAVDLSSLVARVLALLETQPGLLEELRGRFRLIAVDELQDINRPQYELLSKLAGSGQRWLCIGDPDQAIYGFRGSDRALFLRWGDEQKAERFTLYRNYRSTQTIVKASSALMAGAAAFALRSTGSKVRLYRARDPGEEGRFIAESIQDLVGGVDSVTVDRARRREAGSYAFSDIAVLFRTRAVRDALLQPLRDAGHPLTLRSNAPLTEEEPFRGLAAALRLLANPADPVSLRGLSRHAARAGRQDAPEVFLREREALLARLAAEGIGAVIDAILAGPVSFDRSRPEVALGEELIREAAAEHGGDLPGFLGRLSLCSLESEGPRSAQKVCLLTFHAAKGLEFPVVFIAGAEEGITPLPDDLDEERRLFYVAMTRARDALFITHCAQRLYRGRLEERSPSRFLGELPSDCLQEAGVRQSRRDEQLSLFG